MVCRLLTSIIIIILGYNNDLKQIIDIIIKQTTWLMVNHIILPNRLFWNLRSVFRPDSSPTSWRPGSPGADVLVAAKQWLKSMRLSSGSVLSYGEDW